MGKLITEDKEVWKEHLLKNYKSFNEIMKKNWSDQQINEMVEKRVNDKTSIERYQAANRLNERKAKGQQIVDDFKKEYLKTHTEQEYHSLNGFSPFVYCMMDTSGTAEAKQKNNDLLMKLTDRKLAMKEVMRQFKKMVTADPTQFRYSTPEEGIAIYEKNFEFATVCFSVDRMLGTVGNYTMPPELKEFYLSHKKTIECMSSVMSLTNIYANPGKLLIPDEGAVELLTCGMSFSKNCADLVGNYDGFSMVKGGKNLEQAVNDACSQAFTEQESIKEEKECFALIGKEAPATLIEDYKHATIDGKKATLWEGLDAIRKNSGKVEFVKLTDEGKERMNYLLDHALLDEPAMVEAGNHLVEFGKQLQKTDRWFNWNNTNEFKNLLNALKELPTNPNEYDNMEKFTKHFKKIQDLAQAYADKKEGKTLNSNGTARLNICKEILDFTKKSLADDFFHEIIPNQDPQAIRTQVDFSDEIKENDELESILNDDMDKSFTLEKGSEAEQEFLNDL